MQKKKTMLVPTDFGSASLGAVRVAVDLGHASAARIVLLHAYAAPLADPELPGGEYERLRRRAEDRALRSLDELAARWHVEGVLRRGDPVEHVLRALDDLHVDRIVIGTHGRRGVGRLMLGSVAEAIVRRSPVPVMTVREGPTPEEPRPPRQGRRPIVLCGVDFEPGSERAVELGRELAAELGGTLEVCHAYAVAFHAYPDFDPTLGGYLDAQLANAAHASLEGLRVRTGAARWHLRPGEPGRQILDVAEEVGAEVIVLGSHARAGAARIFLGSVAEWVLRRSPVPVLTARLIEAASATARAGEAISART